MSGSLGLLVSFNCCVDAQQPPVTSPLAFANAEIEQRLEKTVSALVLNEPSTNRSSTTDFATWSTLLSRYMTDSGKLRYADWNNSSADRMQMRSLVDAVAQQNVIALITTEQRLAFWINVYNIASVELALREKAEPSSIPKERWKQVFVWIGDDRLSLDDIEHQRLRPLQDSRIHFAINCGATSCPLLRREAWKESSVEDQLDQAAKIYMQSVQGVIWNASTKTLILPKIVQWYRTDFGNQDSAIVENVLPYLSKSDQRTLSSIPRDEVILKYREFDWSSIDAERLQYSDSFPEEVDYWLEQRQWYDLGLKEADSLRLRMLEIQQVPVVDSPATIANLTPADRTIADRTIADRIAETVTEFQMQMGTRSNLRDPVGDFRITGDRLKSQLSGNMELGRPSAVFDGFDGRWFGLWEKEAVNHDWRPSRTYDNAKTEGVDLIVLADQYAWIHNGFGWNFLVRSSSGNPYVLGQVYYLNRKDLKKIDSRKPHVGFADVSSDPSAPITRLVWITEREIFLEQIFPQADPSETYYVITAIFHSLFESKPTVSNQAIQAKYTRNSNNRPAFHRFEWSPPNVKTLR